MNGRFPQLIVDLKIIKNNTCQILEHCSSHGIDVCGVIKGCSSIPDIARVISSCGISQLGISRIEEARKCIGAGIPGPYLLIRVPSSYEIEEMIKYFDYSLESEFTTVTQIENTCYRLNRTHNVIMMIDLGDLREGYWNQSDFIHDCCYIEQKMKYVRLSGIGVNLGCYGAIKPTVKKMEELISIAEVIESKIGRRLEIISGGATTTYTLVHWNKIPNRINHLRIGDNILLSRGLQTNWKIVDMNYLNMTGFVLRAVIVEIKNKPSYPQGEFAFNAYGVLPSYTDLGVRTRALIALGEADIGNLKDLIPIDQDIQIIGGSSDYLIIDITNASRQYSLGDVVEFYPKYMNLLHATRSSDMNIVILP